MDARPTRPGLLVLNDAWMPGWEATVDGHRVPIRRANYLVRGVLLPAGAHRVVFRYPVPASLWLGLGLSVATLAGLLGAWIRRWRRRGDQSRQASGDAFRHPAPHRSRVHRLDTPRAP